MGPNRRLPRRPPPAGRHPPLVRFMIRWLFRECCIVSSFCLVDTPGYICHTRSLVFGLVAIPVPQRRRSTIGVHPNIYDAPMSPPGYKRGIHQEKKHTSTTDATRISYVYVRTMPENVRAQVTRSSFNVRTQIARQRREQVTCRQSPSTGARQGGRGGSDYFSPPPKM